jgi:hypothetical protein
MSGHVRTAPPWPKVHRVVATCALLVVTGCVDRQIIVESNVPNAQVYINDAFVGPAPAYSTFEYYGRFKMTVVYPGYETIEKQVHIVAPWYSYPPIDFFAEAVWPFHIHDTRRYCFDLRETSKTRVDELINNAEALRQRGYNLPIPAHPAEPKLPPLSQSQPQQPAVLPPGAPQTNPVIPSVGPQPNTTSPSVVPQPTPIIPPAGPQAPSVSSPNSIVPSVLPSGR